MSRSNFSSYDYIGIIIYIIYKLIYNNYIVIYIVRRIFPFLVVVVGLIEIIKFDFKFYKFILIKLYC